MKPHYWKERVKERARQTHAGNKRGTAWEMRGEQNEKGQNKKTIYEKNQVKEEGRMEKEQQEEKRETLSVKDLMLLLKWIKALWPSVKVINKNNRETSITKQLKLGHTQNFFHHESKSQCRSDYYSIKDCWSQVLQKDHQMNKSLSNHLLKLDLSVQFYQDIYIFVQLICHGFASNASPWEKVYSWERTDLVLCKVGLGIK